MYKHFKPLLSVCLSLLIVLTACSVESVSSKTFYKEENGQKAELVIGVNGDYVEKLDAEVVVDVKEIPPFELSAYEAVFASMKEALKNNFGVDVSFSKTENEMKLGYSLDLKNSDSVKKLKNIGLLSAKDEMFEGDKLKYKPVEDQLIKDGWKLK